LKFLSSFSTKPIYLFGGLGAVCHGAGLGTFGIVAFQRLFHDVRAHRNPLTLLGFFLNLSGLMLTTQGLLAELIMRTYHESQGKHTYIIRTVAGTESEGRPGNGAALTQTGQRA